MINKISLVFLLCTLFIGALVLFNKTQKPSMNKLMHPSFQQLSQPKRFPLEHANLKSKNKSSGNTDMLDIVGWSYNILEGNPLDAVEIDPGIASQIFNFTWNMGKTTPDKKWLIPDQVYAKMNRDCSFDTTTKYYTGSAGYQETLEELLISDVAPFPNTSFSLNPIYQKTHKQLNTKDFIQFTNQATCYIYTLYINPLDLPPLTEDFIKTLQLSYNNSYWDFFIEVYGTHFTQTSKAGGRISVESLMYNHEYQKLLGSRFDFDEGGQYSFFNATGIKNPGIIHYQKVGSVFYQNLFTKTIYYLGDQPPSNITAQDWLSIASDNPSPITNDIYPLYDLITPKNFPNLNKSDVAKQMIKGLNAYCKLNKCTVPGQDRKFPPAAIVSTNQIQAVGAASGTTFTDRQNKNPEMKVCKIFMNCNNGYGVNGLQIQLCDGVNTVVPGAWQGGKSGSQIIWDIGSTQDTDEYVTGYKISIYNSYPSSIQFFTNKDKVSPLCSTTYSTVQVLAGDGPLTALYGSATSSQLNQLGFYWSAIEYPDQQQQQ